MEEGHTPVQPRRRLIALKFKEKFKGHLEELKAAGVVSGPLGSEWVIGWIHNVMITGKSWNKKKIRTTLDTPLWQKQSRRCIFQY